MPTENLTEEQARILLGRAGASIEVDETVPAGLADLPEPGPSRWQAIGVAVAVAAVIVGGFVIVRQLTGDGDGPPQPIEKPYVYDDDQVPAVLGYTEEQAVELLESKGIKVRVSRQSRACGTPGYVGAAFEQGDKIEPGMVVRLRPDPECGPGSEPLWQGVWELVAFARGVGPAPDLADEVRLAVGEGDWTTLSQDDAEDPDRWTLCADGECHSALGAIAQYTTAYPGVEGEDWSGPPYVTSVDLDRAPPDLTECPVTPDPEPQWESRPTTIYLTVDGFPSGLDHCTGGAPGYATGPVLRIDRDDEGRIAAVRLQLPLASDDASGQWPEDHDTVRRGVVKEFVAWARKEGPPPPFADQVELFLRGEEPHGGRWFVDRPADRSAYALCKDRTSRPCLLDPVAGIERHRGHREIWGGGGDVPRHVRVRGDRRVVVLWTGPYDGVGVTRVEVWVDAEGRIYALNLEPPSV